MDAGVDADEERLRGERHGSASRPVRFQAASEIVDDFRGRQRHLKIHNLLLLGGSRPAPIALRVPSHRIHRLVLQIEDKVVEVVGRLDIGDLLGSR